MLKLHLTEYPRVRYYWRNISTDKFCLIVRDKDKKGVIKMPPLSLRKYEWEKWTEEILTYCIENEDDGAMLKAIVFFDDKGFCFGALWEWLLDSKIIEFVHEEEYMYKYKCNI